jgi:hypothetical protein
MSASYLSEVNKKCDGPASRGRFLPINFIGKMSGFIKKYGFDVEITQRFRRDTESNVMRLMTLSFSADNIKGGILVI